MKTFTAVPAYGRDYRSAKAVRADWAAGKDFLLIGVAGRGYVNKDDAPEGAVINIRYDRQRRVYPLEVPMRKGR
jgi:hypothetical protein